MSIFSVIHKYMGFDYPFHWFDTTSLILCVCDLALTALQVWPSHPSSYSAISLRKPVCLIPVISSPCPSMHGDSFHRVTVLTMALAVDVAVVLVRAWLTSFLCLFSQVVALSSWSLLRDSIYYTLSVVALIVVSFWRQLYMSFFFGSPHVYCCL